MSTLMVIGIILGIALVAGYFLNIAKWDIHTLYPNKYPIIERIVDIASVVCGVVIALCSILFLILV